MAESMERHINRFYSLFGVAGIVFLVIGFMTGGNEPNDKASGQTVLAWYQQHHGSFAVSNYLISVGVVLLVLYVGVLTHRTRRDALWASTAGVIGFTVGIAGFATSGGVNLILTSSYRNLSAGTAQTLNVISNDFFLPVIAGMAIFVGAFGIAFLVSHTLPKWVGIAGVIIGLSFAVPAITIFSLLAMAVWVLMTSIWLFAIGKAKPVSPVPEVRRVAA